MLLVLLLLAVPSTAPFEAVRRTASNNDNMNGLYLVANERQGRRFNTNYSTYPLASVRDAAVSPAPCPMLSCVVCALRSSRLSRRHDLCPHSRARPPPSWRQRAVCCLPRRPDVLRSMPPFNIGQATATANEYFQVASGTIKSHYGQVFWTMMDPIPLDPAFVQRFDGKTIVREMTVVVVVNVDLNPLNWRGGRLAGAHLARPLSSPPVIYFVVIFVVWRGGMHMIMCRPSQATRWTR